MTVSGIVLTHNSEVTIARALESLSGLIDELIVIDDFSSDQTLELVKSVYPTAVIYERKLNDDFAAQRNFALSKAAYDWVLMTDSDEEVTPELAQEIRAVLAKPQYNAYISRRDNQVFESYYPNDSGRPILLKRTLIFTGKIHENIQNTTIGRLRQPLLHHSWQGCDDWLRDIHRYARWRALHWIDQGRRYSLPYLGIRAMGSFGFFFLKSYFVEGKWRGGIAGFLYAFACASEWVFSALFYWEESQKRS